MQKKTQILQFGEVRGHTSILHENERIQGLCHVLFTDSLQYSGRTGAMNSKNVKTNDVFDFLAQNGVATSCSSVHEGIRQNSSKTATKI